MVETVNAEAADLVVITGDYVVEEPWEGVEAAKYLAQLRAKHGVLGVLGDHDFFLKTKQPVTGVIERIREAGVTLLRNEAVELPGGLKIAGIDPTTRKVRKADLDAALAAVPSGGKPHLLLSHAPDIIPQAAERAVPMVLCGHTHGGQVVIPGYGPPVTHSAVGREFASGWSQLKETRMYTGRGLSSHYSLRFCCRPEVTVFTLRRA
jgi:predicted MPP superfamily phosphohydrolase